MDVTRRRVAVAGAEVHLTPREYDLLRLLLAYPGRLLTQRHLLATVWGPEFQDDTHILRTFIHQLRNKLSMASPEVGAMIVNDPGVGYRIEVPRDEPP
ncbi:MAG: winged helix-turn-helix transcriptional regulator [Dehalococcoidia bacterium]|nr:winged helix-turn-helix transcriptional regulator [Dehalococcoidia bacterium]